MNEFHPKTLLFDNEALKQLLIGAETIAKAVGATMGPDGNYVAFGDNPHSLWPWITKDGVTVAREITLAHKWQKIGADLIRQAANEQLNETGDGTTLTTVLAYELLQLGFNAIVRDGANRSDLVAGIQYQVKRAIEELKLISQPCEDEKTLIDVATVSTNGDKELGKLIGETCYKVGKSGIVTYQKSKDGRNYVDYAEGFRWDVGLEYEDFLNRPDFGGLLLEKPIVVVVDHALRWGHEIEVIAEAVESHIKDGGLSAKETGVVIVCPSIADEALETMVMSAKRHKEGEDILFLTWVKPLGGNGTKQQEHSSDDIAAFTGATRLKESVRLDHITPLHLGTCDTFISTNKSSVIKQGNKFESVQQRIKALQVLLDQGPSEYDETIIKESIARLQCGFAVIHAYGSTASEQKEVMERIDDAIRATQCAFQEGVVDGGGVALANIMDKLTLSVAVVNEGGLNVESNPDFNMGLHIVQDALLVPMKKILSNSNVEVSPDIACKAYNYRTGEVLSTSMIENGIVDPTKVIRTALLHASSVACQLLKTQVLVSNDTD